VAAAARFRQLGVFENRSEILAKLAARLSKPGRRLSFCYEAGPCGYGLHRLLTGGGHDCVVVAPSLIPVKAGDRVKTDREAVAGDPRHRLERPDPALLALSAACCGGQAEGRGHHGNRP
jgi:transposase